ncbi:hypothetical protein [Campylobacter anatolicus]|nr:hypothetical protein [Campylobacter anatolicus]
MAKCDSDYSWQDKEYSLQDIAQDSKQFKEPETNKSAVHKQK